MEKQNTFLIRHKEKEALNQYWYSSKTIGFLADQSIKSSTACFMSTPSVFFSVKDWQQQAGFFVFDLDEKFAVKNPNYFKYDFNKPEEIPERFNDYFEFLLVDPPFITKQVWQKYALAIQRIAKKDAEGRITARLLVSSIDENAELLKKLIGVERKTFRPSIPHLVYQYSFYANYQDPELDKVNEQIGF